VTHELVCNSLVHAAAPSELSCLTYPPVQVVGGRYWMPANRKDKPLNTKS
jgi:hypothetical protein